MPNARVLAFWGGIDFSSFDLSKWVSFPCKRCCLQLRIMLHFKTLPLCHRCFREAAGTVAMLPQAEQELELSLAKWQRLHQFMQGLGALQVQRKALL